MTAGAHHSQNRAAWVPFLAAVITYVITRVAFAVLGFRFSPFERPIDVSNLLLDFGAWIAVFAATTWVFNLITRRGSQGSSF